MVAFSVPGFNGARVVGGEPFPTPWHPRVLPLVEGSFQERWEALKRLPLGDGQVLTQLITLADSGDEELVGFALTALGQSQSPRAVAPLVARLDHPDEEVATLAGAALGQMGAIAVAALEQELTKVPLSPSQRQQIARALSHINHPAVVDPLLILTQAPEPSVRAMALSALHSFGDGRITACLEAGLEDDAAPVRQAAVVGLGLWAVRQRQGTPSVDRTVDVALVARWAALVGGRLQDRESTVAEQAAIALGRMATEDALLTLANVAQDSQTPAPLRGICLRALGWVETELALQLLWHVLTQCPVAPLWHTGLYLLGRIQAPTLKPLAVQYLSLALDHPLLKHTTLRQTLALSVRWLSQTWGSPAILALQARLCQDADASVRQHLGNCPALAHDGE